MKKYIAEFRIPKPEFKDTQIIIHKTEPIDEAVEFLLKKGLILVKKNWKTKKIIPKSLLGSNPNLLKFKREEND